MPNYTCYPSWKSIGYSPTFSIQLCPRQWFSVAIHLFDVCFWFSAQCSLVFLFSISLHLPRDAVRWSPLCMTYPFPASRLNSHFRWKLILSYSRLLLMVSEQRTFSILRRQLIINTYVFLMIVVVVLHVSAPYNRTNCLDVRIENSDFDIGWQLFWIPYVVQL